MRPYSTMLLRSRPNAESQDPILQDGWCACDPATRSSRNAFSPRLHLSSGRSFRVGRFLAKRKNSWPLVHRMCIGPVHRTSMCVYIGTRRVSVMSNTHSGRSSDRATSDAYNMERRNSFRMHLAAAVVSHFFIIIIIVRYFLFFFSSDVRSYFFVESRRTAHDWYVRCIVGILMHMTLQIWL